MRLLALALLALEFCHGVVTCGGYVSSSSQITGGGKLDYSLVKMHLFTESGLLKYSTECAPNAYYFIPVYDKGSFYLQIEGPTGWAFEPSRHPFVVNEEQEGCSEDINFRFTGFSLLGNLKGAAEEDCEADNAGPADVTMQLFNDDKFIGTTKSIDGGAFEFENVSPGNYRVTASHPDWTFTVSEQEMTVDWGSYELKEPFRSGGYQLSGGIESLGSPIEGVDLFLFSLTPKTVVCKDKALLQQADLPEHEGHLLCAARSNKEGRFSFAELPCGQYILVPHCKRTHTTFDVKPAAMAVSVKHGNVLIADAFQVLGFSVQGKIVDAASNGIEGATVVVDGKDRAVTDASGVYHLEHMTTGKYTVEARKEHLFFKQIKNFALSPSVVEVPAIVVTSYHICGRVDFGEAAGAHQVVLSNDKKLRVEMVTDKEGNYCFEVVPGTYQITPTLNDAEIKKGIYLSPPMRDVVITSKPNLAADFVQAMVTLGGRVNCLQECGNLRVSTKLQNRGEATFETLNADGSFVFKNVFPGKYDVQVHQPSFCWEKESLTVEVEYNDISDLNFKQNGFVLESELSHDAKIKIYKDKHYQRTEDLERGRNRVCVSNAGVYQVVPVSCFRFDKEEYQYNTASPVILELQARDFGVRGEVLLPISKKDSQIKRLPVLMRKLGATVEDTRTLDAAFVGVEKRKLEGSEKETEVRVFEYRFWASPGDKFELTPQLQLQHEDPEIKSLLFYPRSVAVALDEEECPPPANPVEGRSGLYLKGTVEPSISGAKIVVVSKSTGTSLTVLSGSDGSYAAGPLYEDEEYAVSAQGEGYHFKEDSPGNFRALKLGNIDIQISEGDGDSSGPVAGVLLSLGGENYQRNNETGADGKFSFSELFPGNYFLRPLLKEYMFEPSSKSVDLGQAGSVLESFTAIRVAYSAFGSVRSLNGEPEKNLKVEATQILDSLHAEDGTRQYPRYEETDTDADGSFRLKGLMPYSKYLIKIQSDNTRIDNSSPQSLQVEVGASDIKNVNFVSFRKLSKSDLTGEVNSTTPELLSEIEVVLTTAAKPDRVLKVSKALPFFEFSALPEDNYIVTVRSSLPTRAYAFESEPVQVALTEHMHINPRFDAHATSQGERELTQGSFFSLMLFTLGLLGFLNREKVMEKLPVVIESIMRYVSSFSAPKEVQKRRKVNKNSKGKGRK